MRSGKELLRLVLLVRTAVYIWGESDVTNDLSTYSTYSKRERSLRHATVVPDVRTCPAILRRMRLMSFTQVYRRNVGGIAFSPPTKRGHWIVFKLHGLVVNSVPRRQRASRKSSQPPIKPLK